MDYIVYGILQARILEWVAFPFSRGSSQPRDQTWVSCIAGGFFTNWAIRETQSNMQPNLRLSCYWRGTHRRCRQVPWILETEILVPVWQLTPSHPAHSLDRMKLTSVCSVMSDSSIPWTSPARLLCPWNFPGKKTVAVCHFLLHRIFPTQGSNPHHLHRKADILPIAPPGPDFK